jgi:hypothetical protein
MPDKFMKEKAQMKRIGRWSVFLSVHWVFCYMLDQMQKRKPFFEKRRAFK